MSVTLIPKWSIMAQILPPSPRFAWRPRDSPSRLGPSRSSDGAQTTGTISATGGTTPAGGPSRVQPLGSAHDRDGEPLAVRARGAGGGRSGGEDRDRGARRRAGAGLGLAARGRRARRGHGGGADDRPTRLRRRGRRGARRQDPERPVRRQAAAGV